MRPEPQPLPGVPTEVEIQRITAWRRRIVVHGENCTTDHANRGPRTMAKRHDRRYFHRLKQS
jgi:hypothetical protein